MQPLADHLPKNASRPTFAEDRPLTTTGSKPKPSASLADYLWLHLGATYPHKWVSAVGDDPRGTAGMVWATELAGFTREQIDAGLSACRNSSDAWPPSLPEFKALCLGIPTFAAVRLHEGKPTPFLRLVYQHVDHFRMERMDADKAERMLRDAYELAREHVMRGGALPADPAGEIEHQAPKSVQPSSPEFVEQCRRKALEPIDAPETKPERPKPETPIAEREAIEAGLREHYACGKDAAAGPDA